MQAIKTFFNEFTPHIVSFKDNTFAVRQRTLTGLIYIDKYTLSKTWKYQHIAFCKMDTMEQAVHRITALKRLKELKIPDYGTAVISE